MNFSKKSTIKIYVLTCLALVGLVVSIILAQHFYEIRNGTAGFKSFCNVSEKMNCDVVTASTQAEFIAGLPIASFAAGWFLALFFLTILAQNRSWRADALKASLGVVSFGSLVSLAYLFVMTAHLKTFCLLCLAIDVVNFISLFILLSLRPKDFLLQKWAWSRWKVLLALTAGSLFAMVIGLLSLDQASLTPAEIDEHVQRVLSKPRVSVPIDESVPSIGPKDAKVTIIEFSDFECPFCRVSAQTLNSVLNRYPDKIRVFFRNYPLNIDCNPRVSQTIHPIACEAARASLCAHEQGAFEGAYMTLFEQQANFRPGSPLEIIQGLKLDNARLATCMSSTDIDTRISHDIEAARLLGVRATPTFFINGHKMEGAGYPMAAWSRIIELLLAQSDL